MTENTNEEVVETPKKKFQISDRAKTVIGLVALATASVGVVILATKQGQILADQIDENSSASEKTEG